MSFVVPKFYGRLGNLIFQVSAAIGYAKKYGTDWFIPANYHHRDIYRTWPKLPVYRGNPRKLKIYDRTISDDTWCYEEIPWSKEGLEIRGFFQSELYFKHAEAEVKAAFPLNIEPIDYVSLHVRRGDYLDPNQQTFCPIDMNYITQAMNIMKDAGKTRFMVVSDDLPWCRENIKDPECEIRFSDGKSVISDLTLMASCTDHIMSNSTLAWWGSWFGHNPDKLVITPHNESPNWFLHNRMDTTHLIPESWLKIKYR